MREFGPLRTEPRRFDIAPLGWVGLPPCSICGIPGRAYRLTMWTYEWDIPRAVGGGRLGFATVCRCARVGAAELLRASVVDVCGQPLQGPYTFGPEPYILEWWWQ